MSIVNIPVLTIPAVIETTEDWRDSFAFIGASSPVAVAQTGNAGDGTVNNLTADVGSPIGTFILQITAVGFPVTRFSVSDMNGNILGTGTVGVPCNMQGIKFTVTQGLTPFAAGDVHAIGILPGPVDLSGVGFFLAVRDTPQNPNTLLTASSADGSLIVDAPNGVIGINIPQAGRKLTPKTYCFDVLATSGSIRRVVVNSASTLTVSAGVAEPA